MAKGNFIDYITSNDPNKYPSDGVHTDGYYYKKVTKTTGSTTPTEPEPTLPEAVDGALTFYSEKPFRMCITNKKKNWDGTLYYSLDNSNWSEWNGEFIDSNNNGIIYMRGVGNTYLNTNSVGSNGAFHFETNTGCFIHCIGSMDNLLDYTSIPSMASYCYNYMFYNCTNLVTAPSLPATTLAKSCYQYMFNSCTNLTTAPELPATTLADYCYNYMFYGCTNLITVPTILPATTLANYCYQYMFNSCKNLTTAPQLPATVLADSCYYQMFQGCTNLTTIPELSATTLADYCYYAMFYKCTNIKLSETQTGEYQTAYRIPISGTGTTGTSSLINIFTNTGGTFTGATSINTTYYLSTSNTVV